MAAPDAGAIAEVMLLSEGFANAKKLGNKLVTLYSMARAVLSAQRHYDWGLRSLKAVLSVAGARASTWRCNLSHGQCHCPGASAAMMLLLQVVTPGCTLHVSV